MARLAEFGLDEREAEAYFHLARLGGASASQVAESSQLKRTEVYRVMDQLVAKGFVEATLERPRRFVPLPIEDALAHALRERESELNALTHAKDTLIDAWPRVPSREAASGRYAVHQGRAQIGGLLARMVDGANEEVVVIALRRGLSRLDHMGLFDALAARADDGIAVRVLTQIDESNRPVAEAAAAFARVRHVDLPGYHQMVIVDNREVAMFVAMDQVVSTSGAGETVLWLSSPDFILAQRSLFDVLWASGLAHTDRARELDEGVLADQLTTVRGRWTRTDRVKEMLHRADHSVFLSLGEDEAQRLTKNGLAPRLARLAKAGIDVRILYDGEHAPNVEGAKIRAGRSPMPGDLFLVDEREALMVFGADEEPDSLTSDGEWSAWINRPHTLAGLATQLDTLWDAAASA